MYITQIFIHCLLPFLFLGVVVAALIRHSIVSNYLVNLKANDTIFGTHKADYLPPFWKLYLTHTTKKTLSHD